MDLNRSLSSKLDEANYFLDKMARNEEAGNKKVFTYYLSSFTSASRSVLQYVEKYEKRFYNANIKSVTLKQYFRDIRDNNIHDESIITNNAASNIIRTEITVSGEVDHPKEIQSEEHLSLINRYYYSTEGLSGIYNTESILELGRKYIDEIELFVADFLIK